MTSLDEYKQLRRIYNEIEYQMHYVKFHLNMLRDCIFNDNKDFTPDYCYDAVNDDLLKIYSLLVERYLDDCDL